MSNNFCKRSKHLLDYLPAAFFSPKAIAVCPVASGKQAKNPVDPVDPV